MVTKSLFPHPRHGLGKFLLVAAWALFFSSAPRSHATEPAGDVAAKGPEASLVLLNAKIWTPRDSRKLSPDKPASPSAIAIKDDKILAIGDDTTIRRYVGKASRVIDVAGRRIIPGITDSHTHMISGGFQMGRLALRQVRNKSEFIQAIAAAAKAKQPGEWVLGGRWSVESWTDPTPPHRSWIDPVTGNVPVLLSRMDGHSALANSVALRLAGIDAKGPKDPPGGEIERDPATGEPTGILKESAAGLVSALIPEPSTDERYEALRKAMAHANSLGVTSVHDMCGPGDLDAFRLADSDGAMTVRVTAYLSVDDWPAFLENVATYTHQSDMFRLAGFKGYMDGSLGSRTAYMKEPYLDSTSDTPYPRGQLNAMADPPAEFRRVVALVDARGLQLAVHAIGDLANHLALDAYEAASKANGRRDAYHRVEHAQHLLPSDIARFAELGVVPSMQPLHKADDGRYAEKALDGARLNGSYAFRQLLDAGANLCFGSDWPVVSINPFAGIASAVNATTLDGKVWLASHSISLEEALEAYTLSPARAIHREDRLGTIEPGKFADLVVLKDDPFSLPTTRLADVRVAMTIVAGKIVFSNGN
ncbi:MAG: amidohydrolase [Planctomycetes bacterium]|nr:amidohydrolase [Planctomycetota bacterium]